MADREEEYNNPSIDAATLVDAVYGELKRILLSYSGVMPRSLIDIGKAALSTPGKVMSGASTLNGAAVHLPRWPATVALSYQAAALPEQRADWTHCVSAAAAVEIAMAAADLIDEITDHDPSTVIERYGQGQSLNAANLMLVMAQQTFARAAREAGGSPEKGAYLDCLEALQNMLMEAAIGQHLDMLYEGMSQEDVTLEMSSAMTDMKAGALISGACRIGAIVAGAPGSVVELVARFGKHAGSIAQIENDLRDVAPSSMLPARSFEQKTDLMLRKRTLPIVFTLRDEAEEPNALQEAYSTNESHTDEETLREAVMAAGGITFGELVISVHRENALATLEELQTLRPGAREILMPLLPQSKGQPAPQE